MQAKIVVLAGDGIGTEVTNEARKICLLEGVDDLGYIMKKADAIATHEAAPAY